MRNVRKYNGIPYERITEKLSHKKVVVKAKKMRAKGLHARVDTYKDGYAVWKRIETSGYTWAKDGVAMPEGYNPLAEGEVIGGTYSLKMPKRKEIRPLKIVAKKKVRFSISNKTKLFEKLDRDNERAGVWSMRMEVLVASGKWRANKETYHYAMALHYFNDYFEYEEFENNKRAAIKNGAFHVLFSIKLGGNWYGSHSNVVDYSEAKKDFDYAVALVKEAYDMSKSGSGDAIYDNLYDTFRAADWDKFS